MSILDEITEAQQSEDITIAIPLNNELDKIVKNLGLDRQDQSTNIKQEIIQCDNELPPGLANTTNDIPEEVHIFKENTYENILNEIQEHELGMEKAIKQADELSTAVKESVMYYLKIRNNNRNGLLFHGVPDALNASARLLDLSISGRYKLASMKKLRASILKDATGGNSNNGEINLAMLLGDD